MQVWGIVYEFVFCVRVLAAAFALAIAIRVFFKIRVYGINKKIQELEEKVREREERNTPKWTDAPTLMAVSVRSNDFTLPTAGNGAEGVGENGAEGVDENGAEVGAEELQGADERSSGDGQRSTGAVS